MTGDQIKPYWALGMQKLRGVRAAFLAEQAEQKTETE